MLFSAKKQGKSSSCGNPCDKARGTARRSSILSCQDFLNPVNNSLKNGNILFIPYCLIKITIYKFQKVMPVMEKVDATAQPAKYNIVRPSQYIR